MRTLPRSVPVHDRIGKRRPVSGADENQLGYKHAKCFLALEFVAGLDRIENGKGGYREDRGYEWYSGI